MFIYRQGKGFYSKYLNLNKHIFYSINYNFIFDKIFNFSWEYRDECFVLKKFLLFTRLFKRQYKFKLVKSQT